MCFLVFHYCILLPCLCSVVCLLVKSLCFVVACPWGDSVEFCDASIAICDIYGNAECCGTCCVGCVPVITTTAAPTTTEVAGPTTTVSNVCRDYAGKSEPFCAVIYSSYRLEEVSCRYMYAGNNFSEWFTVNIRLFCVWFVDADCESVTAEFAACYREDVARFCCESCSALRRYGHASLSTPTSLLLTLNANHWPQLYLRVSHLIRASPHLPSSPQLTHLTFAAPNAVK